MTPSRVASWPWVAAALVALVGLTFWLRDAPAAVGAQLQEALLTPYVGALNDGDVARARALHSARRRADVGEIVLVAAWARVRDELGAPVTLRWTGEPAEEVLAPEGGRVWRVPVELSGERGALPLWVDAVQAQGAWRLDETWTRPTGGLGAPRVL